LALLLRRAASEGDTIALGQLSTALNAIRDSAVLEAALAVSSDNAATPPARVVALLTGLTHYDPSLGLKPGSGFSAILGDTSESRCHLAIREAGHRRGDVAVGRRLAAVTERIYGTSGPPALRLFARCLRLALTEEIPLVVPDSVLTMRNVCGSQFSVANGGDEWVEVTYDVLGSSPTISASGLCAVLSAVGATASITSRYRRARTAVTESAGFG
jgi:hypothetical protein